MAFPSDPLDVKVEISPGADLTAASSTWTWTDITTSVRLVDGVEITRGRQDWSGRVSPATCRLRLDNRTGDFTPRNPLGAYYGQLSRNTPIRVQVNPGSGYVTRLSGFVTSWPPRWEKDAPSNASVPIEANGVLRRLEQGARPLRSPIRRAYEDAGVLAYWPLEDGTDAGQLASAFPGHTPATFTGIEPGSDDTLPGSLPLPTLTEGGTRTLVTVPSVGVTTDWQVEFFVNIAAEPVAERTLAEIYTDGTAATWKIVLNDAGSGLIRISALDESGTGFHSNLVASTGFYGGWTHVQLAATQSGGNVEWRFTRSPAVPALSNLLSSLSSFSGTLGKPTGMKIFDAVIPSGVGHLGVFAAYNSTAHWVADDGHSGEAAHDRIERLCAEEGVEYTSAATTSESMGPQPVGILLDLLGECEDADQGVLVESGFGLGYISRAERYNRTVGLALDFDTGDIAEAPEPTDDDQSLRNQCTVSRVDASSAIAEDAESIAAVGLYDEARTVNVETDDVLAGHAAWCVHLGTTDEMRWPRIDLNLARSPGLITDWLACDLQSRVTADNQPDEVAGDDIDVAIEGYDEFLGYRDWLVGLNTSPAGPYNVATVAGSGTATARVDHGSSTLNGAHDSTDTSLSVSSSGNLWTTTATFAADFPFDIDIGGERMTVTAISGTSSPQTFTVTRSVNNVTKSHSSGAAVRLWHPAVVGL